MNPRSPMNTPWRASIARAAMMGGLLLALLAGLTQAALGQSENLLDRITNERIRAFEGKLTDQIGRALQRYVAPSQYVLSVKVIWNKNIIPTLQSPGLAPDKQKLPGFPIFVGAPGTAATDEATPPFVRMVVKVLLDETLPEYYERFIRKITPIVARFDSARGDQVIVLKETFPVREQEETPPTLPEKELMRQLGDPLQPFQQPLQVPVPGAAGAPGFGSPGQAGRPPPIPQPNPLEAVQLAYEEGRHQDALRIAHSAFQGARTNQERAIYLSMEGSILYTTDNIAGARAAWRRALVFDPTNIEVQRVMSFLDQQAAEAAKEAK
ncbi:MAG: hypothetical protein V3S29_02360 [bacterium]